ncbi:MAG: cation diffusion facilitator family transporter [Proteobacteria bacterium]|nr:cation diffusion facilitator family transporter [Pseudomonadota bacterium]
MHSHAGHHHDHGSHAHGAGAEARFQSINLSFIIAVVANLLFTLFEAGYAMVVNSMSLLADAGHNLSDVLGLLLAWGAAYLVTRKSSDLYSYGYRRTTILAAIINAIVLVFVAGYIAVESMQRLLAAAPVEEIAIMIVAGVGIIINAGTALLFARGSKEDLNLRGAYLHLAYDALISAGVVVGAVILYFTGWLWIDPLIGLLIVIVIVGGTWRLLVDSINLILDAVPQGIDRKEVESYLGSIDGVRQVHDLHIWALSTHENCLTAHLVMPLNTLWDSETGYGEIGAALKERFQIHHITLQVEKDLDCATQDCD